MSDRAAIYQSKITGTLPDVGYKVNGVKFDGYDGSRGVLLDAKGPGYATFVDANGNFRPWYRGSDSLLDQAARQMGAAPNTPIEWNVAEAKAAKVIQRLLIDNGYNRIKVMFTPK